jgi:glycosyltransferase involved in cell wall biosynthesis
MSGGWDSCANRVVVCGLARNIAEHVDPLGRLIEQWRTEIGHFELVVFENDSADDTLQRLDDLAGKADAITVIAESGLDRRIPERLTRLAYARNRCLEHIESRAAAPDYVIMIDLDGVVVPSLCKGRDLVRAIDFLQADPKHAAAFANSTPKYYDLFALRCTGWVEADCVEEILRNRMAMGSRQAKERFLYSKQLSIKTDAAPIEVDSAFGGLGIYKYDFIKGKRYSTSSASAKQCEHISLNADIAASGGRLYILPSLIVQAPAEHLKPSHTARLKKQLRKLLPSGVRL